MDTRPRPDVPASLAYFAATPSTPLDRTLTQDEAGKWPELFEVCRDKITAERKDRAKDLADWPFWQFWRVRKELWEASRGLSESLVVSQTGNALAFRFMPVPAVFGNTVVYFPTSDRSTFCILQSQIHRAWVSVFSSTMKDDLRYNPNDCLDTYPFPADFDSHSTLRFAGQAYYEVRADLMVRNNEGLTKTYNRFHDPLERSADILKLRELHAAMDRGVLEAYGWHDLAQTATCDFLLDYEDDEDEENGSAGSSPTRRQKKKPWRYRWPDEFRDEVLARLLELNKQRAEQESLSGQAAAAKETGKGKAGRGKSKKPLTSDSDDATLFDKRAGQR